MSVHRVEGADGWWVFEDGGTAWIGFHERVSVSLGDMA